MERKEVEREAGIPSGLISFPSGSQVTTGKMKCKNLFCLESPNDETLRQGKRMVILITETIPGLLLCLWKAVSTVLLLVTKSKGWSLCAVPFCGFMFLRICAPKMPSLPLPSHSCWIPKLCKNQSIKMPLQD